MSDIYDKILKDAYKPKRITRLKKPKLYANNPNMDEIKEYTSKLKFYEDNLELNIKEINDANEHNKILRNLFMNDAIEYCGLTKPNVAGAAFEYAIRERNSEGKRAVVELLEELSDLML